MRPAALVALILASLASAGWLDAGSEHGSKVASTPCFWQRDPAADFPNEGRNHCAPTSVSNCLIFLAAHRGHDGLVPGTRHEDQVALIRSLDQAMQTDPDEGTNPANIALGLNAYVRDRGFRLDRLEVATWRSMRGEARRYLIAKKPDLAWMRKGAADPDTGMILNAGRYRASAGGYTRKSGHWITVIGTDGPQGFLVHNPGMEVEKQRKRDHVTLAPLHNFRRLTRTAPFAMDGYYAIKGPGLPLRGSIDIAVVDAVIVFRIAR